MNPKKISVISATVVIVIISMLAVIVFLLAWQPEPHTMLSMYALPLQTSEYLEDTDLSITVMPWGVKYIFHNNTPYDVDLIHHSRLEYFDGTSWRESTVIDPLARPLALPVVTAFSSTREARKLFSEYAPLVSGGLYRIRMTISARHNIIHDLTAEFIWG
jgi:hypothetical protein